MSITNISIFLFTSFAVSQLAIAAPAPINRTQGLGISAKTMGPQNAKTWVDGMRKRTRQWVIKSGRATWDQNDNPGLLLEGPFTKNVYEMETRNVAELKGESYPWSDTYWPLYQGQLGARYADPNFQPNGADFNQTIKNFTDGATVCARDHLSPAEKYDLLMGLDTRSPMSLTYKAWESARSMMRNGKVEPWMGICHGWAPVAYMLPRPQKAVTVKAADGQPLTFFVSDIKGLSTLLWATTPANEKFIGGRCNLKKSDLIKMGEKARQLHPECWDTNAGTWHTVVINQLAKGRSFVIDATADYEVWNQPVQSYQLQYYSMVTKRVGTLKSAVREYSEFKDKDPYASQRDKRKVRYIVGVKMALTYIAENLPSHMDAVPDAKQTKIYDYDLELNAAGEIVGGEWHQDDHPDFLWTPAYEVGPKKEKTRLNNSQGVSSTWNPLVSSVPQDWTRAAQAVSVADQPLSYVVEMLIALSRRR